MKQTQSPQVMTWVILIATVVLWSSAFVGIRAAITDYGPGSMALFRYGVASICMIFFCIKEGHWQWPNFKEGVHIFIIGVIGFAIYNVALNYGETSVNSGITSFIMSQIPVGIVIFARLFLHEKLSVQGIIGILISIAGVGIIAINESKGAQINHDVLFLLIAVITGALYSVLNKSFLKKFTPIQLTSYMIWSGTFAMLIYFPQLVKDLQHASMHTTLSVVYLGIFPACFGYVGWSYCLQRFPASKLGSFLYLMPIFTTFMGWLFLSEVPTLISLVGGLIALLGAMVVNTRLSRKPAISPKINSALE
jgi:drug/metabolite transporter (DMT)-like permease